MELSQYDLETNDDLSKFLFTSTGPNGKIKKQIRIFERRDDVFNLVLSNLSEGNYKLEDFSISNNGDKEKILATVAGAIYS